MQFRISGTGFRQLIRYVAIGGAVFVISTGSFVFLIQHHVELFLATSISYALDVLSHFTLNRCVNFRNFDRSWQAQARTYGLVVTVQWLLTLGIVALGVGAGLSPLAAKLVAVATNVPVGFFAHRYLTFGQGIFAMFRRLQLRGDFKDQPISIDTTERT